MSDEEKTIQWKRYAAVLMFRLEGAASSEKVFRSDAARAARALTDVVPVFELLQVSSVTCLDDPPKPDGTNGPLKTVGGEE